MSTSQIEITKNKLEELLRVELAASETYARAVDHAGDHQYAPVLVELKREHDTAVGSVRNLLARLHDRVTSTHAGIVGHAARAVERVAAVFGPDATLKALRAGEQTLATYLTRVADDREVASEARRLVATTLLPAARQRAVKLDHLLADPTIT